ncbi:GON-4-like protein [Zonotrichia leucophrys gambelii]|uniref:GON-4-like protein n=1 Tax=Zonotrichia leucophrys gambelii TaxID=257770 RepID=UPI003140B0E8
MAMALKMLPCKKRRAAAAAAGPPSPRERGEDAELPGGSGAAEGGGSARPAGRGPGEASPKSGRKAPVRAAPSPGQELPAGPGSPAAAAEGKIPKLYSEVEVSSQRDPDPSENPGPVPESAARNPSTVRPPKNSRAEEQDGEDVERRKRRRKASKRKREVRSQEEEEGSLSCDIKLDESLDRTLEDGAKQHNLTVVNVRNILHEVITNEHVVAMVKAAISETEDLPLFEPKMTRSKLKEVVEKGGVIPTWNISPIKKANEVKPPQFVDIPLEEDDSSDEEYRPEEEEEDETAEESLLESDVESAASSPRGAKRGRRSSEEEGAAPGEPAPPAPPRHVRAEVVPMGPPPPPQARPSRDCAFMEKLHAVDEELARSPCMDAFQPLEEHGLIALRTRSKRPLKDVPLGQLEAELRAPDITPDMYEPSTGDDEEWERWLRGLMDDDVGNEDEADDDDDPEYNFLEDLDEPDTEDFRNDRAVRITKKEVNELMEELFETFQGEMGFSSVKDERPEDGEAVPESRPNFNTPQALRFEEPLANLLNKQHQTVKEQLEQLRIKKSSIKAPQESEKCKIPNEKPQHSLVLDSAQRRRLQQQMQQHVQLLTQIHLLASSNPALSSEASTTQMFLSELGSFACSSRVRRAPQSAPFPSAFQPCNLQGALRLLRDFHARVPAEGSAGPAAKSGEALKAPGRSRRALRSRSRRGRARGGRDTAKLLLLYDEDILDRDPLREQKDLAFAQAYLTRVRETLQHIPGKYEDFLRVIYEFEVGADRRTAVDLFCTLRQLLHEWPQLLTDFAAFLLPEQALECGLFEEQQAFEKSRKFLRQLEICFAENPAHHQKIIKVLQSCADCVPQEIAEFDGFEEVSLPDVEEEEEPPKIHGGSRNKKRKEIGGQQHDKEGEWPEGLKECSCSCSCHEGSSDPKLKKSKRRSCSHCGSKVCEGKFYKSKDCQELAGSLGQREGSPQAEGKEPGTPREAAEETLESREEAEEAPGRTKAGPRRGESLSPGSQLEGRPAPSRPCAKPAPADAQLPEGSGAAAGAAKDGDSAASAPRWAPKAALELPQESKGCPRPGGDTEGLGRGLCPPGPHPCPPEGPHSAHGGSAPAPEGATELQGAAGAEAEWSSSQGCPGTGHRAGGAEAEWSSSQGCPGTGHRAGGAEAQQSSQGCPGTGHRAGGAEAEWSSSQGCPGTGHRAGGAEAQQSSQGCPGTARHDEQGEAAGAERRWSSSGCPGTGHRAGGAEAGQSSSQGCPGTGHRAGGAEAQQSSSQGCPGTGHRGGSGAAPEAGPRAGASSSSPGQQQQQQQQQQREPRAAAAAAPGHREEQQRGTEATVCAKNSKVSSTGEKVVLWTREADRVILTTCQERGAHLDTFHAISQKLGNKTASEVSHRFRELMRLFHTSCHGSSEDEEDATSTSNTDQLSDKDLLLSEEEPDD